MCGFRKRIQFIQPFLHYPSYIDFRWAILDGCLGLFSLCLQNEKGGSRGSRPADSGGTIRNSDVATLWLLLLTLLVCDLLNVANCYHLFRY